MTEKYVYRVRILFFTPRKKYACGHTDVEIRMFGKRQYNQTRRVKILYVYAYFLYAYPYFFTHMCTYGRSVKAA